MNFAGRNSHLASAVRPVVWVVGLLAGLAMGCPAAAAAPANPELRLPADHVYPHAAGMDKSVTFRHGTHFTYAGDRCDRCHPASFKILSASPAPTHAAMDHGNSCGICHDGRHAFATRDSLSCASCHSGSGGAKSDLEQRLAPIVYPKGEASLGVVTFRHADHLRGDASCSTCHPRPFAMKVQARRAPGALHASAACGSCHDRKRSFGMDDAATCHRCHVR